MFGRVGQMATAGRAWCPVRGAPDLADPEGMAAADIDESISARAMVGLSPATVVPLVGWGRRALGVPGWYLDGRGPLRVVHVEHCEAQARQALLRGGAAAPVRVWSYERGHVGSPRLRWMALEAVAALIAVPDGDGRLLAELIRKDHRRSLVRPDLAELTTQCSSDPVFLVGSITCEPPPPRESVARRGPAPVHQGPRGPRRVAALRMAQGGHELVVEVAASLVDQPGRWGGPPIGIARRVARVMLARYPDLIPRVVSDALTRTIDRGSLPVAPVLASGEQDVDLLLRRLWAAWTFGPRATVDDGRDLVRACSHDLPAAQVDELLVASLVALQLAARAGHARPPQLGHRRAGS
jgi:hypothetical protein